MKKRNKLKFTLCVSGDVGASGNHRLENLQASSPDRSNWPIAHHIIPPSFVLFCHCYKIMPFCFVFLCIFFVQNYFPSKQIVFNLGKYNWYSPFPSLNKQSLVNFDYV